jgi:hypothetical protein
MAQQILEADTALDPPTLQSRQADTLRSAQDHLQALRQRFETAAEALIRVHDQLKARGFQNGGYSDHRKHNADLDATEPDGGRP